MNLSVNTPTPHGALKAAAESSSTRSMRSCSSCSLRKVCIPRFLDERETQQFENLVTGKRPVPRNAKLLRKQERLNKLFVVRSGQFKLIGDDPSGQQQVLEFYMPGDLMGLEAISIGQHNYQLISLESSEVCEISVERIDSMTSVGAKIQRHLLRTMSESLNNAYSHSLLVTTSLDERFSRFLLQLGQKYARLGYSDRSFRLAMGRGDIGSYLGTTLESVSRLVKRFNTLGAASIDGRVVTLSDPANLQTIVQNSQERVA